MDAVLNGVRLKLVGVAGLGETIEQERLQSHRAGVGAFTAADAVAFRMPLGLLGGEEEQGSRSLQGGRIEGWREATLTSRLACLGKHSPVTVTELSIKGLFF